MASKLGMRPDDVEAAASGVAVHLGQLEQAAATVSRARLISVNPSSHGLEPGDTAVAPWSLDEMASAAIGVRAAVAAARELAGSLFGEAAEQRAASESDGLAYVFPGWVGDPFLSIAGGASLAAGALDRNRWIGNYRAGIFVPEMLQGDPSLRDPVTGLYRRPSGILVPEHAAPQVRVPGTGEWQWRQVGPLRSVANGMAPTIPAWVRGTGRALGPVSTIFGGAMSGYNAGANQWNEDAGLDTDTRRARSIYTGTVTGVSAAAGGAGGAWAGAMLGAAIGSIIPGPGTVVGGVVGGIIGGLLGGWGGEVAGEAASDASVDWWW